MGRATADILGRVGVGGQLRQHDRERSSLSLCLWVVNDPRHHPEDLPGSVRYINALTDAVRSTGCTKLIFYNVSQDFRIGAAIRQSKAQGVTFGWYPTGLNSGHELVGNYLRGADAYPDMQRPETALMPRIVYEFDSPDLRTGTMYPAMP